jgi:hypothetical protein
MTGVQWTPWNGEGPCPVPADARVLVRYRVGAEDSEEARIFSWSHRGLPNDIIAYALEPEASPAVDWKGVIAAAWLAGFMSSCEGYNGEYPFNDEPDQGLRDRAADYAREAPHSFGERVVRGAAIISDCGRYRYRLERHGLSGAGAVAWIMVNPSTADATADDPTIRKVIGFTERLGGGWAIVGNIFAYRATEVKDLARVADPRGPENEAHLRAIMAEAERVIVAWGPASKVPPQHRQRWRTVTRIAAELGRPLHCLGTAKCGHPRHPLMVSYDTPLQPWSAPA